MTREELIRRARLSTQDLAAPYLWADEEWSDFLNEAADQAAIRARLIERDDLAEDVVAGDAYVPYPDAVWSIRRVRLDSRSEPLDLVDRAMLDCNEAPGWEERTGTPWACYEVNQQLRLYPIPEQGGTVTLTAYCTPRPMRCDDDQPALPGRLHAYLLDWALHLAYSKQDTETFDAQKSGKHEAAFEARFGPMPEEKVLRQMRLNVRRHVAGSYF